METKLEFKNFEIKMELKQGFVAIYFLSGGIWVDTTNEEIYIEVLGGELIKELPAFIESWGPDGLMTQIQDLEAAIKWLQDLDEEITKENEKAIKKWQEVLG